MRETDETQKNISPVMIATFVLGIVVLIVAGSYIVRYFSDQAPVNVVVLEAERTSFKEKPPEEKPVDDAATNSTVLIMLEDLSENKEEIEVLSLKPDAPEMPEVDIKDEQSADGSSSNDAQTQQTEQTGDAQPQTSDEGGETVDDTQDVKPVKRPIKPLIIENPVANGPSMMVQLAAFRNQEKAQEVAALLTEKHRERLQGLTLGVMQADTGSTGMFWRVITEPPPTEDARGLCDALKRAGQDCIFRKVAVQ